MNLVSGTLDNIQILPVKFLFISFPSTQCSTVSFCVGMLEQVGNSMSNHIKGFMNDIQIPSKFVSGIKCLMLRGSEIIFCE